MYARESGECFLSYRIGSFNLYKFSFQSNKEIAKDFNMIAQIIRKEKFDIIALQEVLNENAVKRLLSELGSNWDYRWASPEKSRTAQQAEGYAFIWNRNTMELSWTNKKVSEYSDVTMKYYAEPHIYNQYRIDRNAGQKALARNPFYGRFRPKNSFCELRLINTHIRFSADAETEQTAAKMRNNELDILLRVLYHNISMKRYGNNLPAYTILLGDYNLNLKRKWTKSPYIEYETVIVDERQIRTVQDQLTSLKQSVDENYSAEENRGYANNYDHFSYDENRFKGTYVKTKKIDTVRKYCHDDFAAHRKTISDHVPISLSLNLRNTEENTDE